MGCPEIDNLKTWLTNTPTFTTLRINKLKIFDIKILNLFLHNQSEELQMPHLPKYYYLNPDCLIIEQWPDVLFEKTGKEVIVDHLCAAAVLRGSHVFAPGVLGLSGNCQVNEKIDIYADLEGKCKRGLKVTYNGLKQYVGNGYLKMLRKDLFNAGIMPSGIAIHTIFPASRLPVLNEKIYPEGIVLLQNLPSIICGWVMDAQPNECILDMCAAPGNKTTHLAEMSNNQAVKVLKKGGKLVYSTCTITIEENESMVVWALEKFPNLNLIPATPLLGGPGLPNCGLTDEQRIMVQRFGPENDQLRPVDQIYRDSIGFFIAEFIKV